MPKRHHLHGCTSLEQMLGQIREAGEAEYEEEFVYALFFRAGPVSVIDEWAARNALSVRREPCTYSDGKPGTMLIFRAA